MENGVLEVIKHAALDCVQKVGLWEIARGFSIGCLDVGIAEQLILVTNPPAVLLVWWDIISKFILWAIPPKTDMGLEMM
jgi:hypothetical protein